jgi:predicted phage replisome organizer
MSDNKKYYYLKLKDDFYHDERIRIMESIENGIYYSNLLLKLYLKSLKTNGELRFTKTTPYNEQMIATITNMNIDIVRSGLKILMELQFIERMDDGTLYMTEIQNYIGKSSTTADRVREFRKKIDDKKMLAANKRQKYKEPETNVTGSEEQIHKPSDTNVTDDELQMYEKGSTNVTEDVQSTKPLSR